MAGNIEKKRRISIFLGVVWYSISFVLTRDVFYVFWAADTLKQGLLYTWTGHCIWRRGIGGEIASWIEFIAFDVKSLIWPYALLNMISRHYQKQIT